MAERPVRARRRPRIGLRLGSPAPRWRSRHTTRARVALAVGLGVVAIASVLSTEGRAQRTLAAYGHLQRVPVATPRSRAGRRPVGRRRGVEATARDRGATRASDRRRSTITPSSPPVGAGQVVTAAQLAPGRRRGLGALGAAGARARSPCRSRTRVLAVRVGDLVDVLSPDDGRHRRHRRQSRRRDRRGALVVADRPIERSLIAVTRTEAERLAAALGAGVPVLALVGPS